MKTYQHENVFANNFVTKNYSLTFSLHKFESRSENIAKLFNSLFNKII